MRTAYVTSSRRPAFWRRSIVRAVAAVSCALLASWARASSPGFTVTQDIASSEAITSLATANSLLSGAIPNSGAATGNYSVINFKTPNESARIHFADASHFPVSEPAHDHNFAMSITGQVDIPRAGVYSFGVKSNGGFALKVGDDSMGRKAASGSNTKIVTMDFATAGTYPLAMTYYEDAPHASLELFASAGKYHRVHAKGADFQLVGDSADGGLGFADELNSDPLPNNVESANSDPGSGNLSPSTAVPEPSGALLAVVAGPWLLSRRGRRKLAT